MKKSLNKLKEEFISEMHKYPDNGTCSLGHGVYIYKNKKKVEFFNLTRYSQSTDPIVGAMESKKDDFKESGYELKLEYGVMD